MNELNFIKSKISDIEKLANILDDGLLIVDLKGKIKFSNSSANSFLGQDLKNKKIFDIFKSKQFNLFKNNKVNENIDDEFFYDLDDEFLKRSLHIRIKTINDNKIVILLLDMTLQKNLEKIRRDFVANVSHELRSPLTSIVGFLETMLTDGTKDKEMQLRFLNIMNEEAIRMNKLIDDILSLSKVESEEHISPTTAISITKVLNEVISSLNKRNMIKNHKIIIKDRRKQTSRGFDLFIGNSDEMYEVFFNLIENAIKYSDLNSIINVNISLRAKGYFVIDIINRGEGIPLENIDRVTERFYRVDKARSRKIGGTGLGLAIVKHILIKHKGKLKIFSERNKKTIFSVLLPSFIRTFEQ